MLNQLPKDVRTLVILVLIPIIMGSITAINQLFLHWFSPVLKASQTVIIARLIIFLYVELFYLSLVCDLLRLKVWAWLTTLILNGLGVLSYLFALYNYLQKRGTQYKGNPISGFNVLFLVIDVVTIYYLLKPSVRRAFRKTL